MSPATRAQQKAAGWRKAMGDVKAKAEQVIARMENAGSATTLPDGTRMADVVRRLVHLVDSAAGNVRAEERAAFDGYFAALVSESSNETDVKHAATIADSMLEERRRRFGGGKDE